MHAVGRARGAMLARNATAAGRLAAAPATSSTVSVEGTSTILRSPEHVIAQKRRELQQLRPSFGPTTIGFYAARALSVPLRLAEGLVGALSNTSPSRRPVDPEPQLRGGREGGEAAITGADSFEHEFVDVNGIRLHCVSPGRRRHRPLLLMLHGYPECWYSWRHQMAAFGDAYDVVAVDMRGYNDSDKPQRVDDYKVEVLASDVAALVKALGHNKCILAGHDWGGFVAWVVAAMYGSDLLDKLVVLGCPHMGIMMTNFTRQQQKRSAYMLFFQLPWLPERLMLRDQARTFTDSMFNKPPVGLKRKTLTHADLDVYRAAVMKPGAATAMLNYYRALVPRLVWGADPDSPLYRVLRKPINVPTLVLQGDSDAAFGIETLHGIEAGVPQATVRLLRDCSHWLQQDRPDLTTQLIQDWLQDAQPPGSKTK